MDVGRLEACVHADEDDTRVLGAHGGDEQAAQLGLALGGLLLEPDGPVLGPQEGPAADAVAVQGQDRRRLAVALEDVAAEEGVALALLIGLPGLDLLDGRRGAPDRQSHVARGHRAQNLLLLGRGGLVGHRDSCLAVWWGAARVGIGARDPRQPNHPWGRCGRSSG